jgi:cell division septum initiation protein DivIVA
MDRLEAGINRLLEEHAGLTAENNELKESLRAAEQRLEELGARVEAAERERSQVRERVEGLMGRLDGLLHNA